MNQHHHTEQIFGWRIVRSISGILGDVSFINCSTSFVIASNWCRVSCIEWCSNM